MPHPKGYIKRQAKRLTDGEINRRRFVMSALSAGVTMPTALSLASRAEAQVPRKGGHLRLAVADTARFERLANFAQSNALTEIASDGTVTGELAEQFGTPDGGKTWVFDLRRGVSFHDGRPVTSTHVLKCLALRAVLPLRAHGWTEGTHQIVVTLPVPNPQFDRVVAAPNAIIQSAEGVGTGPYRLERVANSDQLHFSRNAEYWKPERAHFDAITLSALRDTTARQHAVMAGDVDYADGIDPRALALLQRAPNVEVLEAACGRHIALTATGLQPDTTLQNLRAALPYQELLDHILLGHGALGKPGSAAAQAAPSKPLRLAVEDDGVPRTTEAARLIAQRLMERGLPIELVAAADPTADAYIAWRCGTTTDGSVTAVWANDISAHNAALTHGPQVATNFENDGARLIERWWFA